MNFFPPLIPPPISNTISLKVVPIGTSIRPVLLTSPVNAKVFVPFDFSVPIELNQSAPFRIIGATLARVSTLLIKVGLPNKPLLAGNGGFGLGIPLSPSIEAIRAVSSPQTNAPAPSLMCIVKLKSEPIMFLPR